MGDEKRPRVSHPANRWRHSKQARRLGGTAAHRHRSSNRDAPSGLTFLRETQADAEQVLLELRCQHLEGRLATVDATVAELIAACLEVAGPRLSSTTLQGYRSKITTHLLPALGDIPLRKLRSPHLDRPLEDADRRAAEIIGGTSQHHGE